MSRSDVAFRAHATALVESDQIGAGTRIWAYCHVLAGAVIGRDCNVGDHCYIERGAIVGNDVVVKNGVALWDGVTLEDRVFVGPNVAFTNDRVPRTKLFPEQYERTVVREGASLGANATLVCGITVGRFAFIGAGAVVTKDVPDFGLILGNPGRLDGFVCRCGHRLGFEEDGGKRATCGCGRSYEQHAENVKELG